MHGPSRARSKSCTCASCPAQAITNAASLRLVEPDESTLIFSFLTIAARMLESDEPIQKALTDKELTKYWVGWGRASDFGLVAVREADAVPISCAWVRQLPATDAAYVGHGVLELAFGTVASERGAGVGTRVLARLIELCRPVARGISLSVRAENPAVRLYEQVGFRTTAEIRNRVGGVSLTMVLGFEVGAVFCAPVVLLRALGDEAALVP